MVTNDTHDRLSKTSDSEQQDTLSLTSGEHHPLVTAEHVSARVAEDFARITEREIMGITDTQEIKPFVPSEEMCDAARDFIMGLEAGIKNFEAMCAYLKHVGGGAPDWMSRDERHITKWDKAECIYRLMDARRPTPPEVQALVDALEKIKQKCADYERINMTGERQKSRKVRTINNCETIADKALAAYQKKGM
jgi:hypothetical protein